MQIKIYWNYKGMYFLRNCMGFVCGKEKEACAKGLALQVFHCFSDLRKFWVGDTPISCLLSNVSIFWETHG